MRRLAGRQAHRDAPVPLERVAAVAQRGPDAAFALLDRGVGQAQDGELREARRGVGLDADQVGFDADDGGGERGGEHGRASTRWESPRPKNATVEDTQAAPGRVRAGPHACAVTVVSHPHLLRLLMPDAPLHKRTERDVHPSRDVELRAKVGPSLAEKRPIPASPLPA